MDSSWHVYRKKSDMKRTVSTSLLGIACACAASAQGFINAGYVGDGFAVSIGTPAAYPNVMVPAAPAMVPAVIPMLPGYESYRHSAKHLKKARKYARKAAEHYRKAGARPAPAAGAVLSTPFGSVYLGTPARYDYDDDWDDDDYEDYYKHMRKKYKKYVKKMKKHHKHHHHDDDDDD